MLGSFISSGDLPTMSRLLRPALALGLALLAFGCPGSKNVKVGAVVPLTGDAQVYGKSIRNGLDVALQGINADKSQPFKIDLTVVDSGSDPGKAKELARQLYSDGAIAVIGGVTSAEALAMVSVADDKGRVLLSPSASQPQLTGISSNFYRVFPSDASEGTMMANYAKQNLELTKVVVLAKQETYAKGAQQVFRETFTELGGQVLDTVEFPPNTTDFAALVDHVGMLKPDAVYIAAYANEIVDLIGALRRSGFAGRILTTSSFAAADALKRAGQAAEGVYYTQTSFEPSEKKPEIQKFVDTYKAKYGEMPDLYAAHGFDALQVMVAAIKDSGKSATNLWKGVRGIRDFPGVTGTFQFDERGDVKKFPRVYEVKDGKGVDIEKDREVRAEEIRKKMKAIEDELLRLRTQGGN